MLRSRNLDDQTFDEIMEFILGRLPWRCPGWTDYNAHDPGITILELMAWYKEMQQYHMNTVTDAILKQLLKLAGVVPAPARAARCYIELPAWAGVRRELARLTTDEGISLEMLRDTDGGADMEAVYIEQDGQMSEVTDILRQPNISLTPFSRSADLALNIGFANVAGDKLRIWFEVDDQAPVARNPFAGGRYIPRVIEWSFVGTGVTGPERDDTRALSVSGYVEFKVPGEWSETSIGESRLKFIRLRLLDQGCEEDVRLSGVSAGRHEAAQQETWSSLREFTIRAGKKAEVTLTDALSLDGALYAFIRADTGFRQLIIKDHFGENGRTVTFDARGAVGDGEPNVIIVSADTLHIGELLHPSTGLPNMRVRLLPGGRTVLTDRIGLICDAVGPDGQIRPAIWRYVDDLRMCSAGDRVFSYDSAQECLMFGDGEHGCIVPRGEGAILIAPFVLSFCGEGNIPAGRLSFAEDGFEVANTAAVNGAEAQSVEDAGGEFLRKIEDPRKCVSGSDYERAAMETPGLRIATARAVAGYDPDEPAGRSAIPVVTVIVAPYSSEARPLPDQRFLEAVRLHIESLRPICTKVKVIAPGYVPIGISLQVRITGYDMQRKLKETVENYLSISKGRAIGDPVVKNDVISRLMELEGVYKVERLELRQLGAGCYMTPGGDVITPRNAIAYLADMDVVIRE